MEKSRNYYLKTTTVLLVGAIIFSASITGLYADGGRNTSTDKISVKFEDEVAVEESLTFFESFMDEARGKSLDEAPVISPLSGKMIKLLMLDRDIVIAILEKETINLDDSSIGFESLTETNQIANFQEIDGNFILTNFELTDSGTLSIDLDYVEKYISENNLNPENIAYVRTGLRPDLAFVYSTETDQIIPFYKNIGGFVEIEGIKNGQIYKVEELRAPLQKYYEETFTEIPAEGIDVETELYGAVPMNVLGGTSLKENSIFKSSKFMGIATLSMIVTGTGIQYINKIFKYYKL